MFANTVVSIGSREKSNMAASLVVPVVDVHNDNFKELWPAMVVAIKASSFIALDTVSSYLICCDNLW